MEVSRRGWWPSPQIPGSFQQHRWFLITLEVIEVTSHTAPLQKCKSYGNIRKMLEASPCEPRTKCSESAGSGAPPGAGLWRFCQKPSWHESGFVIQPGVANRRQKFFAWLQKSKAGAAFPAARGSAGRLGEPSAPFWEPD